jgi:Uma2 family endonuclease
MTQSAPDWVIDPDDPRAPPTEVWKQLSPEQRAVVVASLPTDFPASEASPPEGDDHLDAFTEPRDGLRRWFRGRGRTIYIAGNLPIYYPGERMFSPDLIAVDGAEQRQRDSWIVDAESGKGLDAAIEIVVRGDRKKDLQRNVERYAALGIPEYYLFDRRHVTLIAWELDDGGRTYRRRLAQNGRFASAVLGLDLWLDGNRLRFSVGDAAVPYATELIDRMTRLSTEAHQRVEVLEAELASEQQRREEEQQRREEEQQRREEEQQRREEEQQRREAAEAEVARLRAELEKLRRGS